MRFALRNLSLSVACVLLLAGFEILFLGSLSLQFASPRAGGISVVQVGLILAALAGLGAQWLCFLASMAAPRPWQVVYWCAFTAISFGQYAYIKATGSAIGPHDFSVALHSVQYWRGMTETFIDWSALAPSVVYALGLLMSRPQRELHGRCLAIAALATLLLHVGFESVTGRYRTRLDTHNALPAVSTQLFAGTVVKLAWFEAARALAGPQTRMAVTYRSQSTPTAHIVLVVDESIRADHLSVNGYERPTTPWLDLLQSRGLFANWGVAAAATPDSTDTGITLLTGLHEFPDRERLAARLPTVFQFAKAMNYRTHLLDAGSPDLREGLGHDDLRFIDEVKTQRHFGADAEADFRAAGAAAVILTESTGQFILLFKKGNHMPYGDNYPKGMGAWIPSAGHDASGSAWGRALVNAYDNGIRYNLDRFFRGLLDSDGRLERAVVVYTSDHGQSLTDRHSADSESIAWGDFAVPLLMFGDVPRVDTSFKASHHNLFATLLDLMRFPEDRRPLAYGTSLLRARGSDNTTRQVLASELFGFGQVIVRDFDELAKPVGR